MYHDLLEFGKLILILLPAAILAGILLKDAVKRPGE